MEKILQNLLVADSAVIEKANQDLKQAFAHGNAIKELYEIILGHVDSHIRQYAAVLLRKHLAKKQYYKAVPVAERIPLVRGLFQALVLEKINGVRMAISQVLSVILSHEKKKAEMTNLMLQFIFENIRQTDVEKVKLAASTLAVLTEVSADHFHGHIGPITEMFAAIIAAVEKSGNVPTEVIINIVQSMTHLLPFIRNNHCAEQVYDRSLPCIYILMKNYALTNDVDSYMRISDIVDAVADFDPKLLTSSLKLLIDTLLEIASHKNTDKKVREKAVNCIGWIARLKKKTILKQNLLVPIVLQLFELMTLPLDAEEEQDYSAGAFGTNSRDAAPQALDSMAMNFSPEKIIPPLLQILEPAIRGEDPNRRRAAFIAIGVISEGCSETIQKKYMAVMLSVVKAGLMDQDRHVRDAAFFAVGQFTEYLQPDIKKFANELLPILFEFVKHVSIEIQKPDEEKNIKYMDNLFYALESFCEQLEEEIVPYLPVMVERLISCLHINVSHRMRELAFNTLAAVIVAAKEEMMPYFEQIFALLRPYLSMSKEPDIVKARSSAVDTLAALARYIGKKNFMPLADDTMTFCLLLLQESEDPDLRRSVYNLVSSLSEVVNEQMSAVFPKIMPLIMETIKREEDVTHNITADDINDEDFEDSESEAGADIELGAEDSEDSDDEQEVHNEFLDEKEAAIMALREIANNCGAAFNPFVDDAYQTNYALIDYPNGDIQRAAIESLSIYAAVYFKQGKLDFVEKVCMQIIKKLHDLIHNDDDNQLVVACMECFNDLLKQFKHHAISHAASREKIFDVIVSAIKNKLPCLEVEDLEDDEVDENSEIDAEVIDAALNILPRFGGAMETQMFVNYFDKIYKLMLKKIRQLKQEEDFFSGNYGTIYGTLSECFEHLQGHTSKYFDTFIPIFIEGVKNENDMVRQNAVFGLGELVAHSGEKSYASFNAILCALSEAIATEKEKGPLDNICGAIARLILVNVQLVPLQQVLPIFLENLPLREDFDEYVPIFNCFKHLFEVAAPATTPFVDKIIFVLVHVLAKQHYGENEDCKIMAQQLLQELQKVYPGNVETVLNAHPEYAVLLRSL